MSINVKMLSRVISFLLLLEAAMMLTATGVSLLYGSEGDLHSLLLSSFITAISGVLFALGGRHAPANIRNRDSFLLVTIAWILWPLFGMLPFLIDGHIPNVTDAFFETMSGFSTTGATILNHIEAMPHGLLYWRSLTQWIGGLGIVFFTIAIFPFFGIGGMQFFAAESAGPTVDKLFPRIVVTARWIWTLYLGLTLLEVLFLLLGHMSLFDAVCHAFTTTSTGGFSPRQDSIAAYHSPYIEYVISIFMILSGINFMMLFTLLRGKFKKFWKDDEWRWFLKSMVLFTAIITAALYFKMNKGVEESFRLALFQVASLHTTCGFATADFMIWPPITWACLTFVMITGACAGSTTGGIKGVRIVSMWRIVESHIKNIIHPQAVFSTKFNGQVIQASLINRIFAYAFCYMLTIGIGALVLMALNVGFIESFGCVISALGGVGPGLGKYGPAATWSSLPDAAKWVLSYIMLIGRLELFTVFVLFTREFWSKH